MSEETEGRVTGSLFDRGSSSPSPVLISSREIKLSMLDESNIIFGPPGTGKTTAMETMIKEIRGMSEDPDNPSMAYLTYSRALAKDARERLELPNKVLVGTFHSVLSRLLGWIKTKDGGDYLTDEQISEFCRKYGIKKIQKANMEREDAESDDEWSKFTMLYERSYSSYPNVINPSRFENDLPFYVDAIMEKYNDFKAKLGKHDYVDILLRAYDTLNLPHTKYLIIDEAQDMNPLMWRIIDKWPKDVLVVAGDDDQSIYEFKGATPELFLERRDSSKVFHLTETHRYGKNILEVCTDVSRRIQNREPKEYKAAPINDKVERRFNLEEFLDLNGTKMLLFRTKYLGMSYAQNLVDRRIPFLPINSKHSWVSPWSVRLIKLNNVLADFPDIDDEHLGDLGLLVNHLPASMMRRGIKTIIQKKGIYKMKGEIKNTLITNVVDLIFEKSPSKDDLLRGLKITDDKKRLINKMKKITANNIVYIDTFHAAKGKESDNVAVALDMTKKVFNSFMENPDSEWRSLYVAVSRAKNVLSLFSLNITEWRYPI